MTKDEAYKVWWHNEGSGILPLPNEDMEEFAHKNEGLYALQG